MKYYLYRHIRNDTNEPFYIGIGTKIVKDFYVSQENEFSRAFTNSSRNKHWKNIVKTTDYQVEILLESDDYEFIKVKEKEFILLYGRKDLKLGSLCNWTDGGEGVKGLIFTDEHKIKLSKAKLGKSSWGLGKKYSESHKKALSISHIGIPNSNKGKNYEEIYGKDRSNSIKELMSIKAKTRVGSKNAFYGKNHTEKYKRDKGKQVDQYDKDGNYLNTFFTLSEAAESTGSDVRLISAVCLGKRKTHNNFKWTFKSSTIR